MQAFMQPSAYSVIWKKDDVRFSIYVCRPTISQTWRSSNRPTRTALIDESYGRRFAKLEFHDFHKTTPLYKEQKQRLLDQNRNIGLWLVWLQGHIGYLVSNCPRLLYAIVKVTKATYLPHLSNLLPPMLDLATCLFRFRCKRVFV